MKFKRDYKITISADTNDICFWSVTHKGEPIYAREEDMPIIFEMVKEIYDNLFGEQWGQ